MRISRLSCTIDSSSSRSPSISAWHEDADQVVLRWFGPAVGDDLQLELPGTRSRRAMARRFALRRRGRSCRGSCRRTTAAGRRSARGSKPSMSPIRSSGSGAAMSQTKSHSPFSHTRSMISSTDAGDLCSCSRTRRGVKPRFTSLRRRRWPGSSIEIIIGQRVALGAGRLVAGEDRRVLRHREDVVVAEHAPDLAVGVPVDGGVLARIQVQSSWGSVANQRPSSRLRSSRTGEVAMARR